MELLRELGSSGGSGASPPPLLAQAERTRVPHLGQSRLISAHLGSSRSGRVQARARCHRPRPPRCATHTRARPPTSAASGGGGGGVRGGGGGRRVVRRLGRCGCDSVRRRAAAACVVASSREGCGCSRGAERGPAPLRDQPLRLLFRGGGRQERRRRGGECECRGAGRRRRRRGRRRGRWRRGGRRGDL